jgi:glycosyltransferase involved in cell wall biosynthesis
MERGSRNPATVSVITPVYNGAPFLRECIESVLRQSFQDWEYIIFNNCSTDDTAKIAEEYVARDPRIRLVHASNFVTSVINHNRSLSVVSTDAKYIKFVHADDALFPECIQRMVAVAEAWPSVGLVSSYHLHNRELGGGGVFERNESSKSGREILQRFLRQGSCYGESAFSVLGSPNTVLYRADLVRASQQFYDEDLWHFDMDAACRILLDHDLGFVPQVLSYSRMHPAAATARTQRIGTYLPEELQMLLRYGPRVLEQAEYRRIRRRRVASYSLYLFKQALRPWRHKDVDFKQFHRRGILRLVAEANTIQIQKRGS